MAEKASARSPGISLEALILFSCCFSVKPVRKDGEGIVGSGAVQNDVRDVKTSPLKFSTLPFCFQVAVKIIDKTQLNSSSLQKVGPSSAFTVSRLDFTCAYLLGQKRRCHKVGRGGNHGSNAARTTTLMEELEAELVIFVAERLSHMFAVLCLNASSFLQDRQGCELSFAYADVCAAT